MCLSGGSEWFHCDEATSSASRRVGGRDGGVEAREWGEAAPWSKALVLAYKKPSWRVV